MQLFADVSHTHCPQSRRLPIQEVASSQVDEIKYAVLSTINTDDKSINHSIANRRPLNFNRAIIESFGGYLVGIWCLSVN